MRSSSSIMNVFFLSIVAGLLLSPIVSFAELYKWIDEQGDLHITDAPPVGTHKKSNLTAVPAPQSVLSKKTRVRSAASEPPRAEAHPLPAPSVTSPSNEELPIQLTIEGLKAEISKLREALQMAVDRIAMVSQDYPVKYEVLDAAKALGVVPE